MGKYFLPIALLLLIQCQSNRNKAQEINSDQLEKMLRSDPGAQLIDLRTPAELVKTGRIPGALHVDFYDQDFKAQLNRLDRRKTVILYCAAGSRSSKTAGFMIEMGFQDVFNYTGGMNDWVAKGRPIVP